MRGALHGAGGKGIAPGLGKHAHDRFITGRVGDGAGGQRLLRQLRRPFPVTQFEHRIGHRSLLGRVDAGGRGQLAQRHQRIGLPALRGHRLGPLDRTVHLQGDGEIAHLFRALHFGNARHQRIGGRRPAAIGVEQRSGIKPVGITRRSQRVDQRFRLGQALALDQITGKLITDPRILLVQQQAGMKFLFGGDIIAARGRGTGAIARRPARQPTIGLLRPFICLPVKVCRIGIAPLPLIYVGQQFERRATLRIAGTDQRLGIGLRFAKPTLRQRRAGIGKPAKEAGGGQRLRPLPGRTALRRLIEQVTRFAKAPLAQAHQAKAAQRVGIIAIGRHGALERTLGAIQIIGVERLETARARRATASIAARARGLCPICRRGGRSRRGRRAWRRFGAPCWRWGGREFGCRLCLGRRAGQPLARFGIIGIERQRPAIGLVGEILSPLGLPVTALLNQRRDARHIGQRGRRRHAGQRQGGAGGTQTEGAAHASSSLLRRRRCCRLR